MISCLGLGPMVTADIWRAGSTRSHCPHEGCQAGISGLTQTPRLSLQQAPLTHTLLPPASAVYQQLFPSALLQPFPEGDENLLQDQGPHVFKITHA